MPHLVRTTAWSFASAFAKPSRPRLSPSRRPWRTGRDPRAAAEKSLRTRGWQQRGFTLIELVIVMTIMAISFFAVRPAFSGALRNAQRRAVLRELVSLLTQARTEAVGRGKLVRLLCDPDRGRLSLEAQVDPAQDRSEFEPLPVEGKEAMSLPPDYSISRLEIGGMDVTDQGPGAVYYYPDGSTDGLVLVMEGPTGQQAVIEVLPATGKVSLNA